MWCRANGESAARRAERHAMKASQLELPQPSRMRCEIQAKSLQNRYKKAIFSSRGSAPHPGTLDVHDKKRYSATNQLGACFFVLFQLMCQTLGSCPTRTKVRCTNSLCWVKTSRHSLVCRFFHPLWSQTSPKASIKNSLLFLTFEVKIAPFFLRGAPPRTPGLALRS